jgi:hypothetical protein
MRTVRTPPEGERGMMPSVHRQGDIENTHAAPTRVVEAGRSDTHSICRMRFPNNAMPDVLDIGRRFPKVAVRVLGVRDGVLMEVS